VQTITDGTLKRWTKEPWNSREKGVEKSKRLAELHLPASRRLRYRSVQILQRKLTGSTDIEAPFRLSEALREESLEVFVCGQIQKVTHSRFCINRFADTVVLARGFG
jgi:hypothetical protein